MTEVKTDPRKPADTQSDFLSRFVPSSENGPSSSVKLPELAPGVTRIHMHNYIEPELHTSRGDRYDVIVGRIENRTNDDTVFLAASEVPGEKCVWLYGKFESPVEIKEKYPDTYWLKLEVEKGIQGGHWRGYYRRP